ncbi:16S rRNA (cytidine(1402)-2'-O)-methyltransferase [Domibacillus epiphyticus]|uniref:Ribosomal RNA small subunit methyltransferase I n=1 Tax=Domibacillus epiphyticus TaxID=1714355 RepID=A0A1V2A7E3_9BACI|nr:16S rRNA (cytidine(1402)-2'-O)-methyltransferase [Domibacillus epiphyticus]OMP66850.1 16S rRNA (cytidine(1402)-2'-O)-methyltransferase [Domibacillus epiphyticus]
MKTQKSFANEDEGMLYLVPVPIGNLEDITVRALRIMKEADVIAAEDTRNTKKLCNYFDIATPVVSYHEHSSESAGRKLIERIQSGEKVALVSDAGTPCISDPGHELVLAALAEELNVVPLPGANAAVTALIASGIAPQPFNFYGFLNRGKKEKKKELEKLAVYQDTFILYESPHRLKETLALMEEYLGKDRHIVLCRELTKKFEEFLRGTIGEAKIWADESKILGEFCLIVEGSGMEPAVQAELEWWSAVTVEEHVEMYVKEQNMNPKDAVKQVAKERSLPKRDVYAAYHT